MDVNESLKSLRSFGGKYFHTSLQARPTTMFCSRGLRRIFEILFDTLPPFRAEAGSEIQIDEMYLRESFKGPDKGGRIPRPSRKRGKGTKPGLSRELVCIATGMVPSNNLEGISDATERYPSLLSSSWNSITLFAFCLAVVVLPHPLGPVMTTAPKTDSFLSNIESTIRGRYTLPNHLAKRFEVFWQRDLRYFGKEI